MDDDLTGLITLQVGCLTRYTQKAIDANNIPTALKCFQFVERMINEVEFNIENSLVIGWIGRLKFEKNERLYTQFPANLKTLRIKLDEHYNSTSSNERLNKFLVDISKGED